MVRMAEKSDMPSVRALWQARFGDDDAFCDFFFSFSIDFFIPMNFK